MKHALMSDVGVVRKENQDRVAVFQRGKQTLAILCDGMGGHTGGSVASSVTVDTFEKTFTDEIPEKKITSWFTKSINRAKKEMTLAANGDRNLLDMGTTLTAALITEKNIYVFNIGDSRTYIYNGLLHQVTEDHNLRNYYIDNYGYSPEEAAKISGAAALTSALGPTKKTDVDSFLLPLEDSIKYIILTSDGIHDYIAKPTFEKILFTEKKSIEEKETEIIKQAIRGKSSDNLSIIIVDLEADNDRNA